MKIFGGVCAVLIGIALVFWGINVSLINGDEDVKEAWGNIETAEQRRANLVPQLVETVKGYAKHEEKVFTEVAEARASMGKIDMAGVLKDPEAMKQLVAAQSQLSGALSRLIAVAESNPDLKASENFLALQSQLEGTENRIAVERTRYNKSVKSQNARVRTFAWFSGGYEQYTSFEASEDAHKAPSVSFD